jgi:hypothetical protein
MSEDLVHAVLELTITEADQTAHQRREEEADIANVMQWMSGLGAGVRRAQKAYDTVTLDLRMTPA